MSSPSTLGDDAGWRSVYENSLDGVLLTAPDGRIFAANPAACALLGRTEAEICAEGRAGLVVLDDAAQRFLAERERTGRARGLITFVRKNGTTFLGEVSSSVFVDAHGARRTSMSIHDVTETERSRRTLEILSDAGRVFADSLDIAVTLSGLTRLVVPRLADVCTVDLVEGGRIKRVAAAHRDPSRLGDLVEIRRPTVVEGSGGGVDLVLQTGAPTAVYDVTDEWLRKATHDEEHFLAARALGIRSFVATPLIARDRTIGALTLMSDGGVPAFTEADLPFVQALAERAALAIDNAREHQDAIEARRLRDEVLGIVTHDLRNPLNAILLSAGALGRSVPSRHIDRIKGAVHRADRLIQDLLVAAKADAGHLSLERREESVASILQEVFELHQTIAETKSIAFTVAAADEVGRLYADRHRVVQLLSNLVGNALKFTPAGGQVELRARGEVDRVCLTVSDTGAGIKSEDLPRLFDRFWQGAKAREAGAGLGLAIARGIAQAHGGSISVESLPGRGSTFTVLLPREAPAERNDFADQVVPQGRPRAAR